MTDHGERRNLALRVRRDTVAAWFDMHPRQLAGLSEDVVLSMAERLTHEGSMDGQLAELRSTVERWEQLARTDALTGMANRRAAEERLEAETERAGRYQRPLTLLLADVDGLKTINDRHGHPAGDTLLRVFAQRLSEMVRGTDLLARWGGDEFLVVCPETDAAAARLVADRLVGCAQAPVDVGGALVGCGLSVGWATADSEVDARRLLREADRALYCSKQSGRGRATGAG
jgi:two-component system cell cycle response regulator